MNSTAGKEKLYSFFNEWLQLNQIPIPSAQYIDWIKDMGGNGNMNSFYAKEIQDYMDYIVWRKKGTFNDLITAEVSFPRFHGLFYSKGSQPFSSLSAVYNGDMFSGFTPERQTEANVYPAPNNPGLLTRAGFLAGPELTTTPIHRGVFVQPRILFEPLPSPDFTEVNQRVDALNLDPKAYPNHHIVSQKTSGNSCASFHAKINTMRFAFENFDMLGQKRNKEYVYDMNHFCHGKKGVVAEHNIESFVRNVVIVDKTVSVSGAADLGRPISSSTAAQECLPKFYLRHLERRKESAGDSCGISEASKVLKDNGTVFDMFVRTIANEDIFWRRK